MSIALTTMDLSDEIKYCWCLVSLVGSHNEQRIQPWPQFSIACLENYCTVVYRILYLVRYDHI